MMYDHSYFPVNFKKKIANLKNSLTNSLINILKDKAFVCLFPLMNLIIILDSLSTFLDINKTS